MAAVRASRRGRTLVTTPPRVGLDQHDIVPAIPEVWWLQD
jgi:hypothetical protein